MKKKAKFNSILYTISILLYKIFIIIWLAAYDVFVIYYFQWENFLPQFNRRIKCNTFGCECKYIL